MGPPGHTGNQNPPGAATPANDEATRDAGSPDRERWRLPALTSLGGQLRILELAGPAGTLRPSRH